MLVHSSLDSVKLRLSCHHLQPGSWFYGTVVSLDLGSGISFPHQESFHHLAFNTWLQMNAQPVKTWKCKRVSNDLYSWVQPAAGETSVNDHSFAANASLGCRLVLSSMQRTRSLNSASTANLGWDYISQVLLVCDSLPIDTISSCPSIIHLHAVLYEPQTTDANKQYIHEVL